MKQTFIYSSIAVLKFLLILWILHGVLDVMYPTAVMISMVVGIFNIKIRKVKS